MATLVATPMTALGMEAPRMDASAPQGSVDVLKSMFPEVEADVLMQLLAFHNGDTERVIDMMLDTTAALQDEAETDAAIARRIQAEQDEQMAKAVQASLEEEIKAEEAARRHETDPLERTARAVGSAADMTKAFLQRVRAGSRKP